MTEDKTSYDLEIKSPLIILPERMTEEKVEELRRRYPQPLAIVDSATHEFEVKHKA